MKEKLENKISESGKKYMGKYIRLIRRRITVLARSLEKRRKKGWKYIEKVARRYKGGEYKK